jgi:NAD(P)-dependent dehydrogenase (short-subunit alcohol dehydrogenase family)
VGNVPGDRRQGDVSGRAIVTGAARGLGEAIAARLVADGWMVALVDIAEEVDAVAARLAATAPGAAAFGIIANLSRDEDVERAVAYAADLLGGIDALVNNAGIGGPDTFVVDTDPREFRRALDVNLVGSFLVARAVAGVMLGQGSGGSIVNLGSILGQRGEAGGAAYSASKAGVALLTQVLALELGPHAIRVNTVAPGNMATEMHWEYVRTLASQTGVDFDEALEQVRRSVPLGRHGTGEDIAGAVTWLLSDDASYVTGQTIGVNGGVVLS